jgi:hypothetical protein
MVKVAPVDIGTVSNLLHVANHIDGDAKPFLQRASCTTPVLHVFDLCTSLRLGGRLVARPRLFEPLNSGLRRKLTLIAAPAGYGKTIQAVAWLRARRHLAAIRADDRRFMVGKAHTFLNDAAGAKVSHETALALTERIERWIAGLRLAALSMRGRSFSVRKCWNASRQRFRALISIPSICVWPREKRMTLVKTLVEFAS